MSRVPGHGPALTAAEASTIAEADLAYLRASETQSPPLVMTARGHAQRQSQFHCRGQHPVILLRCMRATRKRSSRSFSRDGALLPLRRVASSAVLAGQGTDPIAAYFPISQMWPPGSLKLAVRTPQGRSIGPFSSSTPRVASSAHIASTSSTSMVN